MLNRVPISSAALVVCSVFSGLAGAQQWGDLEGTIVFKGTPPTPAKIVADKDPAYCGPKMLVDEQILVDMATGGLANVVVYLSDPPGSKPMIHPDLEKLAAQPVKVDNHNCRFEPHVTGLWTKQKLVIGNKDPIGHNTKADFFNNQTASFNITIPMGGELEKKFDAAEASPAKLECSIHPVDELPRADSRRSLLRRYRQGRQVHDQESARRRAHLQGLAPERLFEQRDGGRQTDDVGPRRRQADDQGGQELSRQGRSRATIAIGRKAHWKQSR
jgi:hypothetical protein